MGIPSIKINSLTVTVNGIEIYIKEAKVRFTIYMIRLILIRMLLGCLAL